MSRLILCIAAISLAGCASMGGWRTLRVDASDQRSFEESVALLQSELPYYRNERFTQALAAIWMANVSEATGGDVDHDGDIDGDDVTALLEFVFSLESGTPVLPITDSDDSDVSYIVEDFYRQFDGLGYAKIVGLADPRIIQQYSAYLRRRSQDFSRRIHGTRPLNPPSVVSFPSP